MNNSRKRFGAGVLAGIAGTLLVLFLMAIAVAYSGGYNVAATAGHTAGVRWWLEGVMRSSVRSRAPGIEAPARLAAADIAAGAAEFKAMCEHCHGGPGVRPVAWSRGMLPRPPHLHEEAGEWELAEVFWIVRHGIKYTGMPSFEEGHDEATLWNIAAFVERLATMTPEQYASFQADAHGHHGGSHEHGESHGSSEPPAPPQTPEPAPHPHSHPGDHEH